VGRTTTVLLVAASIGLASVGCASHDPAKRNPCDTANRTADNLKDAANAFHIALPADAAEVSFATSEGGQAYSLTLIFRTTPDGLTRFYATSNLPLPAPASTGQQLAAGTPKCELDRGFTYSAIVSSDSTYSGQIRSLAVDNTKSDAPRVLVVAAVL
jgi:hypothetical protein